jgi:signal transduction histidine kinase
MIGFPEMEGEVAPSVETIDIVSQIEHAESVPAQMTLETVYEDFRTHGREFAGVVEGQRLVGIVSRGHVGFLLGARYGFAIYGRRPVVDYTMPRAFMARRDTPINRLLEEALGRGGETFHDDVAIVDEGGDFLGFISVRTLVQLQSRLVGEKRAIEDRQRVALAEKNRQLFRTINELRQSQGRFEILFENSALGVALIDAQGNVETCNRQLYALLALDEQAMDGTGGRLNLADFVPEGKRASFLRTLRDRERTGKRAAPEEMPLDAGERGPRTFRLFLNWIAETGQICVLVDDVTEQRAIEKRVAQEEKSALLDSLVGGIAHEINNKLSPIIGFSELLMAQAPPTPDGEFAQFASIIRESAIESAKIIAQLLQLSRPGSAERTVCDMAAVVEESLGILRLKLRETGVRLEWAQSGGQLWVNADVTQLKQVIINLVLNAADAMEESPEKTLRIAVKGRGDWVELALTDSGQGIEKEHLNRVFDPFFTTKGPSRGTGLGLSVCLSIVRQHGGNIVVESEVGVGSTFRITLPASEQRIAAGEGRLIGMGVVPSAEPVHTGQVCGSALVVDDEEYITGLLHEALRARMGLMVQRVSRGRDAIEYLATGDYDLVISDIRMPGFDGFELFDWVCKERPDLREKFLFITGDAGGKEMDARLEELGAPVLRKPFSIDALVVECREILDRPAVAVCAG